MWLSKSRSAAMAAAMWALGCPCCSKAQAQEDRHPSSQTDSALRARGKILLGEAFAPAWAGLGLRVSCGYFGDAGWTRGSADPVAASGLAPRSGGSESYGYAQAQWDLGARWPVARGWALTARAERSGAGDPMAAGRAGLNPPMRFSPVDLTRGLDGLVVSNLVIGADRAWPIGAGIYGSLGMAVAERTLAASAGGALGPSMFAASATSLTPWARGTVSWVSQDGAWKAKAGAESSQKRDSTQWKSEVGLERFLVSKPWGQLGVEGAARWSGVGVSRTYQMGGGQSVDVSLKARARSISFGLFAKF